MNIKNSVEVVISQKVKLTHIFFFLGFKKVLKLSFIRNQSNHVIEKARYRD